MSISIKNPEDLVGASVALLGFNPEESLIVQFLNGRRLSVLARLDLADYSTDALRHIISRASKGDDAAAIIIATATPRASHETATGTINTMLDNGFSVVDAMYLTPEGLTGTFDDLDAMPVNAFDSEAVQTVRAESLALGRAMLPNRAALVRSVAHNPNLEQITTDDVTACAPADTTEARCQQTVEAMRAAFTGDQPDWPAFLATITADVQARDEALIAGLANSNAHLLAALTDTLARCASGQHVAELASILAMLAYRSGDGTLANIVLDRALEADPQHRMSNLAASMLNAGMPPEYLDGLLTSNLTASNN